MSIKENTIDILQKAVYAINERSDNYTQPEIIFNDIAARWSKVLNTTILPSQVCECMAELKQARLENNPDHEDSLIDWINYKILAFNLKKIDPKADFETRQSWILFDNCTPLK